MTNLSLLGTASYLPERVVTNDFFGESDNVMFRGSRERRHAHPDESAAEMIFKATNKLCERLNISKLTDVGIILCNVTLLDMPFMGVGASVAKLLGAKPELILDVHNAGCISFIYMMRIAKPLLETTRTKTALICNVQNTAGPIFGHHDNIKRPQSAIPGDGCGVGLFALSDISPVESIVTYAYGEYADDMKLISDEGAHWHAPRKLSLHLNFDERKIIKIIFRGNKLVPSVIREACQEANVRPSDADILITNQPNPFFLRNWREALEISECRQVHTFDEHGNTFGAAIPISLERAHDRGMLKKESKILLGGFSHAGDYAAAAVLTWHKGQQA
ncbi:MAG TPA: 3-oxoacyl-[acyl-carrier-protein] synthase III C-terminal domain-containing protein [Myxococcota bacterium]|nr:3-oxoacyl-[acyl-carrier-protein] synthase III C-terminal domain-containing protein [Myxococcota bacterium]